MTDLPWWREAVVYEVYVRSFADSDGDGVGDLEGIRSRLPYLRDLGVDALWLTPFYPSPMADHGYDVADYCDVDPRFGDLATFDALLADAHALGLRVIVDVVPNHTSSAHPWFQQALADPSSPARARYWFRDGRGADGAEPPNNWQSVFGGPAWTRVADGQWYLHLFDSAQPDLDWADREVHDEFLRTLGFWLDRGVDGFRIDVAHALYKRADLADDPAVGAAGGLPVDSRHVWDRDEVLTVYEQWRQLVDRYPGDRMLVGEVFLYDVPRVARYVGDTRLHQAFNFTVFRAHWGAPALREVLEAGLRHFDPGTWVLSNHDLTRHVTRYGGGDLGRRRGLAITALLLALPGSPYLYQGEELGLEETHVPPDRREDPVFLRTGGAVAGRDGCRTPMPWLADGPGHGFTTGEPWLPFGSDAGTHAVQVQEGDPASVLRAYRRLLSRRRALLSDLTGTVEWLPAPDDVLAVRRGRLVAVLNTASEAVEVRVADAGELLEATADGALLQGGVLTVPAAATVWLSSTRHITEGRTSSTQGSQDSMTHATDVLDHLPADDDPAGSVLHSFAVQARFRCSAADAEQAEQAVRHRLEPVRGLYDDLRVEPPEPDGSWAVDARFVVASLDGETAVEGVHATLREQSLAPDEVWLAEQLP